jgi:cell wall-associated NlpC family hydrolase
MTSKTGLSGLALAYLSVGAILMYEGIENTSTATTLKSLLSGNLPAPGPQTSGTGASGLGGGAVLGMSATGLAVAQNALTYVGAPYVWGGGNPDGWDCSGFVNYVLGHNFGLTLPGGVTDFDGSYHGPVVSQYVLWTAATRVSSSAIQAGDLICYPPDVHMGIAINGTQLVSAEDPSSGTQVSDIGGWLPYVVVRPNAYQTGSGLSGTAKAKAEGNS